MIILKKRFLIICGSVLAILLVFNIIFSGLKSSLAAKGQEAANNQNTDAKYLVVENDGYISVYFFGTENIYRTLKEPLVSELPEHDAKLLKTGIAVNTLSELEQLIEDYDGITE